MINALVRFYSGDKVWTATNKCKKSLEIVRESSAGHLGFRNSLLVRNSHEPCVVWNDGCPIIVFIFEEMPENDPTDNADTLRCA